jgi:hypothetical protein
MELNQDLPKVGTKSPLLVHRLSSTGDADHDGKSGLDDHDDSGSSSDDDDGSGSSRKDDNDGNADSTMMMTAEAARMTMMARAPEGS